MLAVLWHSGRVRLQEDREAEWQRELGSFTDSSTYLSGESALSWAACLPLLPWLSVK